MDQNWIDMWRDLFDLASSRSASGFLLVVAIQAGSNATALAADSAQIEEGMRVYKTAVCEFCHGWAGDNGTVDEENEIQPGPSLVVTKLNREKMIELVSCGTPGGLMPQYLATAWTEQNRCYGKVGSDLLPVSRPLLASPYAKPPGPYSTLRRSEIEAVVAFVQEVYQLTNPLIFRLGRRDRRRPAARAATWRSVASGGASGSRASLG